MAEVRPSATFAMFSARAAMAAGLSHIEAQVNALESAVSSNPGFAFDLAKTLIESTCRAILRERKIEFESDDDLPKLFKAVTTNLPFLPPEASGEVDGRKSLKQTVGGLQTALQGVCELRNHYGFASHGAESSRASMESVQALLAAQAADAIIGFLHRVHRREHQTQQAQLNYEDNPALNEFIDDANPQVHIFDFQYNPSEVFFRVDLEAYRELLDGIGEAVAADALVEEIAAEEQDEEGASA
jgi:hypothetical protein